MRFLSVLLSVVIIIYMSSLAVFAANDSVSITLETQDQIKPGKSFNVSVRLRGDNELGSVLFKVYHSDKLSLKSASIDNKGRNEFLKYNDTGEYVFIHYAVKNLSIKEKTLTLRFMQDTEETECFDFSAEFLEAVNSSNRFQSCGSCNKVTVSTIEDISETAYPEDNGSVSSRRTGSSDQGSVHSSSRSSRSENESSGAKKRTSKSSSSQKSSASESSLLLSSGSSDQNTPVHRFDYDKYRDELSDNSMLYYTIGIIIILIVVIILAARFAKKLHKNNIE